MERKPEDRIKALDRKAIIGLRSEDITEVREAYESLPANLSKQEVLNLGLRVNVTTGDKIEAGKKLEVDTINKLGGYALAYGDLTTARSAADALSTFKHFGLPGKIVSMLMRREIRLTEAQNPALV